MTALTSAQQGPPMPGEDIEESNAASNQTSQDGNMTNQSSTTDEEQTEENSSSVIQKIIRILSVF